jgi:hypothetical protein
MLAAAAAAMRRSGVDAFTATMRALKILDLRVLRQATVLAYNHVFWLVAVLFALALPLVVLVRGRGAPSGEVMAE